MQDTVELLGLTLTLRSGLGRGSCFRLELPGALRHPEIPDRPSIYESSIAQSAMRLVDRRILLIDDDPMVRQAMQALLRGWGVDLRIAALGDENISELCGPSWIPEIVISDFRLPGSIDGIELLDLLLNQYPSAVGILQTGELAPTLQARAEETGYLVLYKPVDPAILASTLIAVLEPRQSEAA